MTLTMSATIKGVTVSAVHIATALDLQQPSGFTKAEFGAGLIKTGMDEAVDPDFVRRVMQALKRQNILLYDADNQLWELTEAARIELPMRTKMALPVKPINPSKAGSEHTQTLALPMTEVIPRLGHHGWPLLASDHAERLRFIFSLLACLILIGALVGLNASFAWELGQENPRFQIIFMLGLLSLDLLRPAFVFQGIMWLRRRQFAHGVFAILIALILAPVSVLSSTSILSASFLRGDELSASAEARDTLRGSLERQHARLIDQAEVARFDWQNECNRGGCGPIAAELESKYLTTLAKADATLDQIVAIGDTDRETSELLARMVETFEGLGLFGAGRELWLPLFLALSLEIAALFGPALLLRK